MTDNERIAELKGLFILEEPKSGVKIICLNPEDMWATKKDWQNNIAENMELWWELPWHIRDDRKGIFTMDSEYAKKAVCDLWIKWRQSIGIKPISESVGEIKEELEKRCKGCGIKKENCECKNNEEERYG